MSHQINLDLSAVSGELSQFQQVPAGTYDLTVTNVDWKETNKKTGEYLQLSLQVVGGEHAGKTFSSNINIVNENPKTVKFGKQTLKQIMTEIEHANPEKLGNTAELINGKCFRAIVELEAFTTTTGSTGYSSSIKRVVSKEVALVDGSEAAQSTRPAPSAAPKVAPAPTPAAAPPVAAATPAPAPVSTPAPAAAPATTTAKPPWQK